MEAAITTRKGACGMAKSMRGVAASAFVAAIFALVMAIVMPAAAWADDAGIGGGTTSIPASGGDLQSGEYKLTADTQLTTNNLVVPAGAEVVIDLDGHNLIGNGNGSVVKVLGKLTIKDGSEAQSGSITGGNANVADDSDHLAMNANKAEFNGGGVFVDAGGSLQLDSGNISENQACNGGGVYVSDNASFIMNGGAVSNNESLRYYHGGGGGIYVYGSTASGSFGTFEMNGGKIVDNSARTQGGGIFTTGIMTINDGEFSGNVATHGAAICSNYLVTINGGKIVNNFAKYVDGTGYVDVCAGGVHNNGGILNLNGGSIQNNSVDSTAPEGVSFTLIGGGGIYGTGTINVQGAPVVSENTVDDKTDNCMLSGATIEIVGNVDAAAKIGVNVKDDTGKVTGDLDGRVPGGVFTADHAESTLTELEEAYYLVSAVSDDDAVCYATKNGQRVNFASLASALSFYPVDDNKIILLKDIDLTQQIATVPGNDTVLSSDDEHVISWTAEHTGSFFNVKANSSLSIEGKIVIKGNRTSDDYLASSTDQRAFSAYGTLALGQKGAESEYPKIQDFSLITASSGQSGAGVYVNKGAKVDIFSGTYSHNRASNGGFLYAGSSPAEINIHGGSFEKNMAQGSGSANSSVGGAISVVNFPLLVIDGGTFANNEANGAGGAVYLRNSKASIGSNVEFAGNEAKATSDNKNGFGGAICASTAEVTFDGESVLESNNAASRGGGVYAEGGSSIEINGAHIVGNTSKLGGGVYVTGSASTFEMNNGLLRGNSATNNATGWDANQGRGAGLFVNGSHATLNGGSIDSNSIVNASGASVSSTGGAGVCVTGESALFEMNGGSISNNSGAAMGGGLYLTGVATGRISSGSIVGNSATNGAGALVGYNVSNGKFTTLEMSGGLVSGNVTTDKNGYLAGVRVNSNGNNSGALKLSGSPVIQGNGKVGDMNYGVFLPNVSFIDLAGEMTQGASVVITTRDDATKGDIQITNAESDTEYYKNAAQYLIPAQGMARSVSSDDDKYVKFTTGESSYNITFDLSHAKMESGASVVKVDNGGSLKSTIVADEGYLFDKDATAPEGVDSYSVSVDGKTAEVELNSVKAAKTISIATVPIEYSIAFDGNGAEGSVAEIDNVKYDEEVALPENKFVAPANKYFDGWAIGDDDSNLYKSGDKVKNLANEQGVQVVLKPHWADKATLTINEEAQNFTYSGGAYAFVVASDQAESGFVVSYKSSDDQNATYATDEPINAGTYDVQVTRAEDDNLASFSTEIKGGLVIDKADLNISFKDVTDGKVSARYGDGDFTQAATVEGVNGETFTPSYSSSNPNIATVDVDGKVRIGYPGTVTINASVSNQGNYNDASASYELAVGKKLVSLSDVAFGDADRKASTTYDGTAKSVLAEGVPSEAKVVAYSYADKDGNSVDAEDVVNAGTYKVTATFEPVDSKTCELDDADAEGKVAKMVELTIAQAEIPNVSADGWTGDFDKTDHSITVNAPEGATVYYRTSDDSEWSTNADDFAYSEAGTHTVNYKVTMGSNYMDKTGSADVVINTKLIAKPTRATSNQLTYNGSEQTYIASSNDGWYTVTDGSATNANAYEAKVALVYPNSTAWDNGDGTSTNEELSYTYTINPYQVQFLFNGSENGVIDKTFGDPDFTVSVTAKGVNGESVGLVENVGSEARKVVVPVGETGYSIVSAGTATIDVAVSGNYGNYTGRASFKINVAQAQPTVDLAEKESVYTGNPIVANAAVVSLNDKAIDGAPVTYKYYTNEGCTDNESADAPTAVGNYWVKATFEGDNNLKNASAVAKLTIKEATISGFTVTGSSSVYDGHSHGVTVEGLPEGAKIKYGMAEGECNSASAPEFTDVCDATVYYEVSKTGHAAVKGSVKVVITPATIDMSGIEFRDQSFTYDGGSHSIGISGTLPEGVSVSYIGNGVTNVKEGGYTVQASFELANNLKGNYKPISAMTATLTINPAVIEVPAANATEFVYSGQPQKYFSTLDIPSIAGKYAYSVANNVRTNAGAQTVTLSLVDKDNTVWKSTSKSDDLEYEFDIAKQQIDVSGVQFANASATYDGTAKSIQAADVPEGVNVAYAYEQDGKVVEAADVKNAGTYKATATLAAADADNTELTGDAAKTATLAIDKKQIEAPAADTTVFDYNGKAQTYAIAASEWYEVDGNVQTEAGTYEVTVSLNDANNTVWSDGTSDAKVYAFTIRATSDTTPSSGETAQQGTLNNPVETTFGETVNFTVNIAKRANGGVATFALTQEETETVPAGKVGFYYNGARLGDFVDYDAAAGTATLAYDTNSKVIPAGSLQQLKVKFGGTDELAPSEADFFVKVDKANQTLAFAKAEVSQHVGTVSNALSGAVGAVTYSTSDPKVATVATDGIVTIVAPGAATITATAAGDEWRNEATATYALTATEHAFDETHYAYDAKNPAKGHWQYCTIDGCTATASITDHVFGDWKVSIPATATAAGEREHECMKCGYEEAQEIPAATAPVFKAAALSVHISSSAVDSPELENVAKGDAVTYSISDEKVATIDASGKVTPVAAGKATVTATVASADGTHAPLTATYEVTVTDHEFGEGAATAPATCTEPGVKTFKCKFDGCDETKTEVLTALGHAWADSFTVDTPATCTTDGSQSKHCTRCGESDPSSVEPIPATGHQLVCRSNANGHWQQCAKCDYATEPEAHQFGEWTVTKEATATEAGEKAHTCAVCGYTATEEIAATGDNKGDSGDQGDTGNKGDQGGDAGTTGTDTGKSDNGNGAAGDKPNAGSNQGNAAGNGSNAANNGNAMAATADGMAGVAGAAAAMGAIALAGAAFAARLRHNG